MISENMLRQQRCLNHLSSLSANKTQDIINTRVVNQSMHILQMSAENALAKEDVGLHLYDFLEGK